MSLAEILSDGSPVMRLAQRFVEAGHQFYLVGGPVRDAFLGLESLDYDFATDAEPDETMAVLKDVAHHVWKQGVRFGTVGAEVDGITVEITTFRTERYQPASRHPEVRFAADIETDLLRRDFTVNAMAVRLPDKQAVDPHGGLADLRRKVLRTPQDPVDSFSDDPLRMLRAFRFMSQLGFSVDPTTFAAIVELKEEIATISAERIRDELSKLLIGKKPGLALEKADESGLTDLFLPELGALKLEQDPVKKHKDVFHHTLKVVEQTPPVLPVRLAALLHDIGKPRTRQITEDGVTFHNHQVVGAKMARKRLRELRFPNEIVDEVYQLIYLHHRFHTYKDG
ncbi:MAG: HDIG domain-containing metalloprotein [Actinomycetota bacterium]